MRINNSLFFTVLLSSIIVTSCIPKATPIPNNIFNVNLQHETNSSVENDTTIAIDNDSISFQISQQFYFTTTDYLILKTSTVGFEILNISKYWYNYVLNSYDSTNVIPASVEVNTLNAGITIDNNYTTYSWKPFLSFGNTNLSSVVLYQTTDASPNIFNGIRHQTDEYIVLRKPKNSSYQYYWIRVRADETTPNSAIYQLKILNGKYQLNTITTGQ